MKKNTKAIENKITYLHAGQCTCPKCGSRNIQGISRVTGYMSLDERFGEGKVAERKQRLDHNGGHKLNYKLK